MLLFSLLFLSSPVYRVASVLFPFHFLRFTEKFSFDKKNSQCRSETYCVIYMYVSFHFLGDCAPHLLNLSLSPFPHSSFLRFCVREKKKGRCRKRGKKKRQWQKWREREREALGGGGGRSGVARGSLPPSPLEPARLV